MAKKLNKTELIRLIASDLNQSQEVVGAVTDALVEQILTAAENGTDVALHGFGTFSRTERAARMGRNPKTGESLSVAASSALKFKPAQAVKIRLNS